MLLMADCKKITLLASCLWGPATALGPSPHRLVPVLIIMYEVHVVLAQDWPEMCKTCCTVAVRELLLPDPRLCKESVHCRQKSCK